MPELIRVFVGCAANHEDAESQAVLEWSIKKHASLSVDITWMKLSRDPQSYWHSDGMAGWRTENWATPFSGFRWAIPEVCEFNGRAIYTDSDVIFMDDIAKLWQQEFAPGKAVAAKGGGSWRYCVSLWDCAAVKPHMMTLIDQCSDPSAHAKMTQRFRGAEWVQPFEGNWNCLDGEQFGFLDDPAIKAIHYTVMANQPHLPRAIERLAAQGRKHWFNGQVKPHWRKDLVALFEELLQDASENGHPVSRYCTDQIYGEYKKRDLRNYRGGPRRI